MSKLDFFDIGHEKFSDIDDFTDEIKNNVELGELDGKLSVIGAVSKYDSKEGFVGSLEPTFEVVRDLDNLLLLRGDGDVPFYVHLNDFCPLFFTIGTKTEDLPGTIDYYLQNSGGVSRLWVGKKQMDDIRQQIIRQHGEVRIPYFTAHHSPTADDPDITRPGFERTIQYYGEDGRKSFKELKSKYGVFPTNVQFQNPNGFKFRITNEGVFTINSGPLDQPLELIKQSVDQLREVKKAVNTSSYREISDNFNPERQIPQSEPWGIQLETGLNEKDVRNLKANLHSRDWKFKLSRMQSSFGDQVGFRAEVTDQISYGRAAMRTRNDLLRVYPREHTSFSQFIRLFSFVSDHIDQFARPVAL